MSHVVLILVKANQDCVLSWRVLFLTAITPLVIDAKAVATNPTDRIAQRKLRESTRKVL